MSAELRPVPTGCQVRPPSRLRWTPSISTPAHRRSASAGSTRRQVTRVWHDAGTRVIASRGRPPPRSCRRPRSGKTCDGQVPTRTVGPSRHRPSDQTCQPVRRREQALPVVGAVAADEQSLSRCRGRASARRRGWTARARTWHSTNMPSQARANDSPRSRLRKTPSPMVPT